MSLLQINHNIASMDAQRNLTLNTNRIQQSIARLSSGLRINSAADDPAGLVLSEHLKWQVSGLQQAQQNATQGINLVKTADGGLNEVQSLLRQIRDLAVDAASDSNNNDQSRQALQEQVSSALTAIDQIVSTTKYADRTLLDGSAGIQAAAADATDVASASFNSSVPTGYADVNVTSAATQATLNTSDTTDYTAATDTIANAGTVTINGTSVALTSTMTVQNAIDAINAMSGTTGVTASFNTDHLELQSTGYGSNQSIAYTESAAIFNGGTATTVNGTDAAATVTYSDGSTGTFDQGSGLTLQDSNGNSITLTSTGNAVADYSNALFVSSDSALSFQIGADKGETASISIGACDTAHLGTSSELKNIDVSTVSGANDAMDVIDEAINQVSNLRARIGAFQSNQLQAESDNIAVAAENLQASQSSIADTDFGQEMSNYTTAQILVQAATSFLSQANSLPSSVTTLIRGG